MEKLSATLTGCGTLAAAISIPKEISVEEYAGPYEFTPGQDAQVVAIADKKATADITIGPIPDNYGLITWDGATLTVS